MTVFAICMTALSAFLLGLMCRRGKEKPTNTKGQKFKEVTNKRILDKEYLNFLNYDGTTQK